jgi:hypothetical protein
VLGDAGCGVWLISTNRPACDEPVIDRLILRLVCMWWTVPRDWVVALSISWSPCNQFGGFTASVFSFSHLEPSRLAPSVSRLPSRHFVGPSLALVIAIAA